MKLQLYDSYRRKLLEFVPLNARRVGMYACGPTVYHYAHLGNLRTYIFEDILRRTLEFCGYEVRHVVNITDVGHLVSDADTGEDKMERGARRTGKTAWEIAAYYTRAFQQDCAQLNLRPPSVWCRATEHIAEQIADIAQIAERGFTYTTADGVYFDTSKQPSYGKLARLSPDGLEQGARVDMGEKKNPTDFALWKFTPPGQSRQMEWESPWGRGFPGWHIECSAMAHKYLGPKFDIHCGGKDHIPVHHCNEIAQAEVCFGTTLANFWLHGYFLELDNAKMSKSSGEFLRLQSLRERGIEPLAFRYLCLTAHYRSDLKFAWENLESAKNALARLRSLAHGWGAAGEVDAPTLDAFGAQIGNDLNTPRGLAVAWNMAKGGLANPTKKATLLAMDEVLGLKLGAWQPENLEIPPAVAELVRARTQARAAQNWQEADRLRDAIHAHGFAVDDSAAGSEVRRR